MATSFNLGDRLFFQGDTANKAYPGASSLINNILPNVYVAAGLIIFFMIILGGFTILTGAKDPHKIEEGGKTITSAIMGLLVLFASYWIIQIIQVITGASILNSSL